jgi:hypothetical protein
MSDARSKHSTKSKRISTEVMPPAVIITAEHLRKLAMRTRAVAAEEVLPGLLETMEQRALDGALEMLVMPDAGRMEKHDFLEALQPELHRLGMRTEILKHTQERLGMTETRTAMVVSWRE